MKIIFLDFDGVLNSAHFFGVLSKRAYRRAKGTAKATNFLRAIDPEAVALLNEVVRQTSAKIVVSASYRIERTVSDLQDLLDSRGFLGDVIAKTPNLPAPPEPYFQRGSEIAYWLAANGERLGVERFVILDDSDDMGCLLPHLVRTTWARGFERVHAKRAVEVLSQ